MGMQEAERLQALSELDLLDSLPEAEYDQLCRLAASICGTPISLISLVDANRQWFKAALGVTLRETPRELSFCAHAIESNELFVVADTAVDPRFANNLLVTGAPKIRFYAGVPLQAPGGAAIGTLCVIDTVPRQLEESQRDALTILAAQVQARIALRAEKKALEKALADNQRLAARLQESNDLFHAFMDNAPFAGYIKDREGRYRFYNKHLQDRFGVDAEQWFGLSDHEVWSQETAEQFRAHDLSVWAGGVPVEFPEVSHSEDGTTVTHWRSVKFPIQTHAGETMLAGLSIDISAEMQKREELERALHEKNELAHSLQTSELLFRTFLDVDPNFIYMKTEEGRYVFYNRRFAEHHQIDQQAWIGRTDHDVFPAEIADGIRAHDLEVLQQEEMVERTELLSDKDGRQLSFKTLRFTYRDAHGDKMLAGVSVDITEQVRQQQALSEANRALEELARTDSLTGLPVRRVFEERIAMEFSVARRKQRPLSMLMMDIDNFKVRNDRFGHAAGDEALRVVGEVLLGSGRIGDLPARLGGEEFGFLLPDTNAEQAKVIATRVQSRLRERPCGALPLTVSIGIACSNPTIQSWERLVACADDAMYAAKRAGKNCVVAYQEHIAALMVEMRQSKQDPQHELTQTEAARGIAGPGTPVKPHAPGGRPPLSV